MPKFLLSALLQDGLLIHLWKTVYKVDKTNVAIFACRYYDMNTLMQKWQILHEYTIQQIFIFGYPVFCLIIVKLIIRINSKGDSILIKLLRHE